MTFPEALRILNVVLIIVCIAGFVPAVKHASDIDRLLLLGGGALLTSIAGGSLSHLHDPFNPWLLVAVAAEVIWLIAAWELRRRRLSQRPGGGRA